MPVLPSFEQLKNKLITKNQEPEIVVSQTESNEKEEIGKNVLLKDSSINQWLQEYAYQRKAEDKMLEFMIFHERLFEIKDNVLVLKFGNEMEQNHFNALKNEFNVFLKAKLGFTPKIETVLEALIEKKQLYSSSDKYNHLKELFPQLEELKRRLGLELDM